MRYPLPFAALAVLAGPCLARPVAAQGGPPVAVEHVNVVTMVDTAVLADRTVVIVDGAIRSLGDASSVRIPSNAIRVDGTGRFLIPGLADTHVHLLDANDFPLFLAYGVTTVLNMTGNPMVLAWRDRIADGSQLGPTLYTTGPQIKPEPHPLVDFITALTDRNDAARVVGEQVDAGYDLIKVWGSHDPPTLAAIIRAADSLGVRVTGHLSNLVGLEAAVALGQSSIAHLEELINKYFRRQLDSAAIPAVVREAQRGDLAIITTLATYDMIVRAAFAPDDDAFVARVGYDLLDPVRQMSWRRPYNGYRSESFRTRRQYYADALAFQLRLARAFGDAGVTLLAGTDAGMLPGLVPGLEIHRELALLVESGLTAFQALAAATRNPGAYLGDGRFGRIVPGARADLVLLDRNPLADISATRAVHAVIVHGRLLGRSTLDSLVADVRDRNVRTAAFVERAMGEDPLAAASYAESVTVATGRPAFALTPVVILAVRFAEGDRTADAMRLLELAAHAYPDAYLPEFVLGRLRLLAGDMEGARRSFRRVLQLVPDHYAARREVVGAEATHER